MLKLNALGEGRTKIVGCTLLLAIGLMAADSAVATNVFGGGATLPAGAYVGFGFANGVWPADRRLSTNTSDNNLDPTAPPPAGVAFNSLFGAWAATSLNAVSYCQTGSGNGKKIFDHTDGNWPILSAVDFCTGAILGPFGVTNGFGAAISTTVDPHFAASDAPMSQAEYAWFFLPGGKAAKYTQPVQFPTIAGSVAIVINNTGVAVGNVNLTDAQLCGVFSGQITRWSGLGLPADPWTGDNISVVYLADESGTTFSLMNHLSSVCQGTALAHFVTDQKFTNAVGLLLSPSPPANFKPAFGDQEAVRTLSATHGSIGYAAAGNVKNLISVDPTTTISYARINGLDPFADLPKSITVATIANSGIVGVDSSGRPVVGALTPIAAPGCMSIVNPSAYATSTTRYPIIALSYVIANNTGNGADVGGVRSFVNWVVTQHPEVTTIGVGTGYAYVVSPLTIPRVNTCILS